MKKAFWILLAFFAVVISFQPLLYFSAEMRSAGLLGTKSAELLNDIFWKIPFYIHIAFGGIALLTGWPQFNQNWRKKSLSFHRNLGKIYVISALIAGITGLIVAFNATGGLLSQTGFSVLAILWLFTTIQGYLSIKNNNITAHENWMIRSFALCFAGVTLRLWIPFFMMVLGFEFVEAYKIIAWLAWVPNLLLAEVLIKTRSKPKKHLVKA